MIFDFRIWVRKFIILFKRKFCLLLLLCGLMSIYWIWTGIGTNQQKLLAELLNPPNRDHSEANYFANVDRYISRGYVLNTPSCTILDMDPFDPSVLPVLNLESKDPPNCYNKRQSARRWTYTNGSTIVFNTTALREDGFSFDYLDCCYIHFDRVEQSIDDYNYSADRTVKVSPSCKPIRQPVTQIQDKAIRIICRGKWPLPSDVLYREFHPLVKLSPVVQKRLNYWKSQGNEHPKPPSIIMIGVDSTSRLNFHRNMPKTKAVLQKLGFIEFYGYTKVQENTFPNVVAIMSGYNEKELGKICFVTEKTAQDNCPYIWKRFQNANYLTGIVEDKPNLATFHFEKTGFVHEPVDHYLRPFFLGVGLNDMKEGRCVGTKTAWEVLLKYTSDLNQLSAENQVPLFLYSWSTSMTHDYLYGAEDGDNYNAEFFKKFDYTNSIVIFMGDHGYRFGKFRETFVGWYEDKLPNFWIYLPKSVKSRHPTWFRNLQENARKVTSPFDLFYTMSHVLDEYTSTHQMPLGTFLGPSGSRTKVPRVYGQSLFNPISKDRNCDEAGIPSSYCACFVPQSISINDTNLKLAAQAAVQRINAMLTPNCANLTLVEVTAGARLKQTAKDSGTYIIGFTTKPGNFLFEGEVRYSGTNPPRFDAQKNILRMNKISTDVSCVEDSVLQRFCYCTNVT